MIDPHMAAFTAIAAAVRVSYSTVSVYPETMNAVTVFPCVMVQEIDNPEDEKSRSMSNAENATRPVIQIDVFANTKTGNLAQRKAIGVIVDGVLRPLGWHRTYYNSNMPNEDANIKRLTARYSKLQTT